MNDLQNKTCKACIDATESLSPDKADELRKQLDPNWDIVQNHHLQRTFKFKNFKQALLYTNKVGELAEREGHHPDILLKWGEVQVTIFTHKVNGLTESDFILAAKIDALPVS